MPFFKKKIAKNDLEENNKSNNNDKINENEIKIPKQDKTVISKKSINIGGLPVNVFGLEELNSINSTPPPEICAVIHMHGRGGSANNEEKIVRQMYENVNKMRKRNDNNVKFQRDLLFINFNGRNHGERLTNKLGQKTWKEGNLNHAIDLYSMILGNSFDCSFIINFLESYLFFNNQERKITKWIVTGKSLGGHSCWHVLANDERVSVGIPFISSSNFLNLIENRAKNAKISNAIPISLKELILKIDPGFNKFLTLEDSIKNPFYNKKILMLNGEKDSLVPISTSKDFINELKIKNKEENFKLILFKNVGHQVNEKMIFEASNWIFLHGILIKEEKIDNNDNNKD